MRPLGRRLIYAGPVDSSEIGYLLAIVVGLPVLVLLLTGPGMWSEKWGWGPLKLFDRLRGRNPDGKHDSAH